MTRLLLLLSPLVLAALVQSQDLEFPLNLLVLDSSDESTESDGSLGSARDRDWFGSLSSWFGFDGWFRGSNCGSKEKCPKHGCRYDPAVIHGYCCGCASIFDDFPFLCPLGKLCPSNLDLLCKQFDWMIDCCCPEGVTAPTPETRIQIMWPDFNVTSDEWERHISD